MLAQHDPVLIERDRLRGQLEQLNANTTELFRLVSDIMTDEQWSEREAHGSRSADEAAGPPLARVELPHARDDKARPDRLK